MLNVFKVSMALTFFVVVSQLHAAECPSGTRNNYKGECVPITPGSSSDSGSMRKQQEWIEPKTDASEIVEVEVIPAETEPEVDQSISTDDDGSAIKLEDAVLAEESIAIDTDTTTNTDLIGALTTIRQLRGEIQDLLNRVELQRYELEKLRGRQMDLYNDLDYRLREQERLTLAVPPPVIPSVESIVDNIETMGVSIEPVPIVAGSNTSQFIDGNADDAASDTDASVRVSSREPEPIIAGADTSELAAEIAVSGSGLVSEVESVILVGEPNPVVVGSDLPLQSLDSSVVVIEQPKIELEDQDTTYMEAVVDSTKVDDVTAVVPRQNSEAVESPPIILVDDPDDIGSPTESNSAEIDANLKLESTSRQGESGEDSSQESRADELQEPTVVATTPAVSSPDELQEPELTLVSPSSLPGREHLQSDILGAQTPTVSLGEQEAYDHAFNMLKQSRYEDAAKEFANFLRQYRNGQLTDDAWYWMAEAYYVTRDYEQALIAFNTVVSYFTDSPRIPASRLKIGYVQYEISDYVSSRETLTMLLKDFPAHRVAVSAEARLKKMDREGR